MGRRSGKRAVASRLHGLRTWVTVPEAAEQLSRTLGEGVRDADVFRLALDGYLTLSVNLVNGADASRVRWVPLEGTQSLVRQTGQSTAAYEPRPVAGKLIPIYAALAGWNTSRPVQPDISHHEGETLEFEDGEGTVIYGVWDLPMIGNERHDVERRCQRLEEGPDVKPVCWEGAFVKRDGNYCLLRTRTFLPSDDAAPGTVKGMIMVHPANALPPDSVLVVRPSALAEFHAVLVDRDRPPSKVGGPRLAAWLKKEMQVYCMTLRQIQKDTRLDRKTIKKILDGRPVRRVCLDKLPLGLEEDVSDIPTN